MQKNAQWIDESLERWLSNNKKSKPNSYWNAIDRWPVRARVRAASPFIYHPAYTRRVLAYIIKFAHMLRVRLYMRLRTWARICCKFFLCGHCAIRKSRDLYALIKVPVYYPIDLSRAQKGNNNNSKECRVKSGFSLMFRFEMYTHTCLGVCLHLALVFCLLARFAEHSSQAKQMRNRLLKRKK